MSASRSSLVPTSRARSIRSIAGDSDTVDGVNGNAAAIGILAAVVATASTAGTAFAGPLEVELGPSAVVFDTPHAPRETIGAAAITAALHVDPRVPVSLRMHLAIGRDGAGTRMLGIVARQQRGRLVIDTGGIASVIGTASDLGDALRPRGFGLALDVRVGYAVGPVTIAAFALPTWVFVSDAAAREGRLRSIVEAGISVGRAL